MTFDSLNPEPLVNQTEPPSPPTYLYPTGAQRANLYPSGEQFPARYDLLFGNEEAMRRIAETCGEGCAKYGPFNWHKGFPASMMISHCLEHIRLWLTGDRSEDHLAHAAWNLHAQMWYDKHLPELNDINEK